MYEKCLDCDRLGKDCIPNIYAMSVDEIRSWARKLKEKKGWTNSDLAKASGVPKGTIDSSFSKHGKKDVNYSTFAPILCALIGGEKEMLCYKTNETEIEKENIILQNHVQDIENLKAEYEKEIIYLKDQIQWKRKIIKIMIAISCILLFFVCAGLVVDWMNPNYGLFRNQI